MSNDNPDQGALADYRKKFFGFQMYLQTSSGQNFGSSEHDKVLNEMYNELAKTHDIDDFLPIAYDVLTKQELNEGLGHVFEFLTKENPSEEAVAFCNSPLGSSVLEAVLEEHSATVKADDPHMQGHPADFGLEYEN